MVQTRSVICNLWMGFDTSLPSNEWGVHIYIFPNISLQCWEKYRYHNGLHQKTRGCVSGALYKKIKNYRPHPRWLARLSNINQPIPGSYLRGEVVKGTLASSIVLRSQTMGSTLVSQSMFGISTCGLCISKLLPTSRDEDCIYPAILENHIQL